MKLVFAGGEHAPVELDEGVSTIGAADADIELAHPGIAPRHAEIERQGARLQLRPCAEPVRLNGRPVRNAIVLKPGDTLEFAGVRCRLVDAANAAEVEDRSTRLRSAVPKFVLRGVSGPTFGRSFAIAAPVTLGRQADCDICIPIGEISRHHARLKPAGAGVQVEDLDSANGTYINGKRVRTGTLRAGDELALDTVRFMLLTPGAETAGAPAHAPMRRRSHALRIVALIVLAVILGLLIARAVHAV
ncbi:MAG: FHA domain-containing protein [Rhodanobacteraceae bacterium]